MVRRKSAARSSLPLTHLTKPAESEKKKLGGQTQIVAKERKSRKKMKALQEIKYLQKTTKLLIPKLPFSRLVKAIVNELFPRDDITRMQASALEALHEAAEIYLTQFFEDATLLSFHAKRVTLMRNDMILMRRLRGRNDIINK